VFRDVTCATYGVGKSSSAGVDGLGPRFAVQLERGGKRAVSSLGGIGLLLRDADEAGFVGDHDQLRAVVGV
jgi:hypothetical protein